MRLVLAEFPGSYVDMAEDYFELRGISIPPRHTRAWGRMVRGWLASQADNGVPSIERGSLFIDWP